MRCSAPWPACAGVYDPGYSYVRANGYSGDAYYGCCGVGLIGGWYGFPRYYGGYYSGRYGYGCGGRWSGHPPYHGGRPGFAGRHIDHAAGHDGWHGFRGGIGYRAAH